MIRKKLKNTWFRLFARRMLRKIEHDRSFSYKTLQIDLEPGVFHPRYFKSSQFLLEWVEEHDVKGKTIIEIGAGSGITSLRGVQKGAKVWATDIHPKAIELLQHNAKKHELNLQIVQSDLFDDVERVEFSAVLINPPFYPKRPRSMAEHAWFCGEEFEYFQKLFRQLDERVIRKGIYMTLSDDCDIEHIQTLAAKQNYVFTEKKRVKQFFETNFLFEIHQNG